MNYNTSAYNATAAEATRKSRALKIPLVIGACVLGGLFVVTGIAIAVGLALGLGVDLSNNDGSSSSYSILSAPLVNCTYNGPTTCGCSTVQPSFSSPRIVQGDTAVANSWPWIVSVYLNNGERLCGGFLISGQHVVTAAHCVFNVTATTILVYGGVQNRSERASAQVRDVSTYTTHPDYAVSPYIINDIAVIELTSSFDLASTALGVCCLPSDTVVPSQGEKGVIAGWGVTSGTSSTTSDGLLQAVVQVQGDSSTCSASSTSSLRFCAGYGSTDSCYGDSGGPFMISSNNAWSCVGIVSAEWGCGRSSYYTRVSAYRQFIRTYTGI